MKSSKKNPLVGVILGIGFILLGIARIVVYGPSEPGGYIFIISGLATIVYCAIIMERQKALRKIVPASMIFLTLSLCISAMPVHAATYWEGPFPNEDLLVDETLVTYNHGTYGEVGLSVNLYEINKDWPQPGQYEFAIAVVSVANSRYTMGYQKVDSTFGINIPYPKTLTLGDDEGAWLNVETGLQGQYNFLFYGAWYNKVFVTSNGRIILDERAYNDHGGRWTSPNPKSIPTNDDVNGLIAPFWRDLDPSQGGSIIYGTDAGGLFAVAWVA